MRARALAIILALTGTVAFAGTGTGRGSGDDSDQLTISAKDLKKYFEPYVPAVRDCYVSSAQDREATGRLQLEMIIHRDGTVVRFGFEAPGVRGAWLRRLDGCLRELSETWHFPVRRGFTTAMLPFYFQRTLIAGR